jgi:hypothetical protein
MALKPGQVSASDFSESMAEAMEDALRRHWPIAMPGRAIPFDERFLKLFFVAIAQGVVRHLEENPLSFNVEVNVPDHGRVTGKVFDIETNGVDPAAGS